MITVRRHSTQQYMELRFAHLCDYAAEGKGGKLTIVGLFSVVSTTSTGPVKLPRMFLVARFEAHVTEGTEHEVELRFTNEDGKDLIPRGRFKVRFMPQGPRRPLIGSIFADLQALQVPGVGDYAFHLFVNDRRVGEVPLYVQAAPARPRTPPAPPAG